MFCLFASAVPTAIHIYLKPKGSDYSAHKRFASFCMVAAAVSGVGSGLFLAFDQGKESLVSLIGEAAIGTVVGCTFVTPVFLVWFMLWSWVSTRERNSGNSSNSEGSNDKTSA